MMIPTIKILAYVCFLTTHELGRSYGKVCSRPEVLEVTVIGLLVLLER